MTLVLAMATHTSLMFAAESLVTGPAGEMVSDRGRTKIFVVGGFGVVSYGGSRHPLTVPKAMLGIARSYLQQPRFEDVCVRFHSEFRKHVVEPDGHGLLVGGYEDGHPRLVRLDIGSGSTDPLVATDDIWTWAGGVLGQIAMQLDGFGSRPSRSLDARWIAEQVVGETSRKHPGCVGPTAEMLDVTTADAAFM